jgi:hypothetical protein
MTCQQSIVCIMATCEIALTNGIVHLCSDAPQEMHMYTPTKALEYCMGNRCMFIPTLCKPIFRAGHNTPYKRIGIDSHAINASWRRTKKTTSLLFICDVIVVSMQSNTCFISSHTDWTAFSYTPHTRTKINKGCLQSIESVVVRISHGVSGRRGPADSTLALVSTWLIQKAEQAGKNHAL